MSQWKQRRDAARRSVQWPGGARMAMTIGVALEAFENQSQLRLAGKPGERDSFSLSYGEYGVRVGVWRLLDLFDEYGVRANFSVSGRLAQQWPDTVAAVAEAGHEIIGHGWVNDVFMGDGDLDAERRIIAETLDAIESATGVRPTGWASPANSSSARTTELMLDAGIIWSGDDASDDVPFVETVGDRRIAVLPKVNMAANDLIHWILPTNHTDVFVNGFLDQFTTLYAESSERPQWSDMVLHCHMAGRPVFIPALRQCLDRVKAHGGIWWTTKQELAEWTLAQGFTR